MNPAPPQKPGLQRPFRAVALVFVALLVVGFALGVGVYQKYVAYVPTAAHHVPEDATMVARVDLTHVMLYAPFRTSLLPLVDHGDSAAVGRAARLASHGVRLGADVRELMVALGPAELDWVLVIGGQLPRQGLGETVRAVLADESRGIEARPGGVYCLAPSGPWFGQATDGAFALASSEARLRAALPIRPENAALAQAAGGLILNQAWLGKPFKSLRAQWRAGSVVAADVQADFSDPASGEAALRSFLNGIAKLDPALALPTQSAEIRTTAAGVQFRLNLPQQAVERVASLAANRVSNHLSHVAN